MESQYDESVVQGAISRADIGLDEERDGKLEIAVNLYISVVKDISSQLNFCDKERSQVLEMYMKGYEDKIAYLKQVIQEDKENLNSGFSNDNL